MIMKKFLKYSSIFLVLALIFIFIWFFRYRYYLLVSVDKIPEMELSSIDGYTDKMFYFNNEKIKFYLRSTEDSSTAVITKIISPYQYEPLDTFYFDRSEQNINPDQSESGCNWDLTHEMNLNSDYTQGYYNVILSNSIDTFNLTITIGDFDNNNEFVVFAPLATFAAYNPWGGKSLYHNYTDSSNVFFVSTQRPNTGVQYFKENYNHIDVNVCANIFNYFYKNQNANILPDYYLEERPEVLSKCKFAVLSYHCEYFSEKMYDKIEEMVFDQNIPLISLGANQIFWKVKWHDNFTRMECRKDLTFFGERFDPGGMWRHNLRSESDLLGVRYTGKGLHTFAPYKVLNSSHWLYSGLNISDGELFGIKGINSFPICGDETDKVPFWMEFSTETIAKGLNTDIADTIKIYNKDDADWNSKGGGEIVLREIGNIAVLSTGSIYSGSGLGSDKVFTGIIDNFLNKYFIR